MSKRTFPIVISCAWLIVACSKVRQPDAASMDAGVSPDAAANDAAAHDGGRADAGSHDAGRSSSDAGGAVRDAGQARDAGQSLDDDASIEEPTCHDAGPPPDAGFVEGGATCTLPDGGQGVGRGSYGCVDWRVCHCRLEAGSARCDQGVCVYDSCSGANEDEMCKRPDGTKGRCCAGTCKNLDDFDSDPNNCNGCGVHCPPGQGCTANGCGDSTSLGIASCDNVHCADGFVCATGGCTGHDYPRATCNGCFIADCKGQPEGSRCAIAGMSPVVTGLCCGGVCVQTQLDPANCGGCGLRCCSGGGCYPGSYAPQGECY